uniref:Uncharacterized protein n=1 Tax=Rhodnius prolixus TaxID=13249 RepID=T1I7C0_RHOPR
MDPKVTQHLIKTSKSLREKFKSLKRGLHLSQQDLERSLKPITKPLQELVEQNKKRSKKTALKSDASTSTTSLEECVKLPLKEEEEVKLPLKASTPIPRKDVLDIKMEEETFEDDDSPLEQIKQIHSKEELEKSLEEIEEIGSLIKPYLLKHMTSDTNDLDQGSATFFCKGPQKVIGLLPRAAIYTYIFLFIFIGGVYHCGLDWHYPPPHLRGMSLIVLPAYLL